MGGMHFSSSSSSASSDSSNSSSSRLSSGEKRAALKLIKCIDEQILERKHALVRCQECLMDESLYLHSKKNKPQMYKCQKLLNRPDDVSLTNLDAFIQMAPKMRHFCLNCEKHCIKIGKMLIEREPLVKNAKRAGYKLDTVTPQIGGAYGGSHPGTLSKLASRLSCQL